MEKGTGDAVTKLQNLRNIGYAIATVVALAGIAIPEDDVNAIVLGVAAAISIAGNVVAWWNSRKKFTVVKDSPKHLGPPA